MTSSKARVIISGTLFVAWLGFLVYLVLHTRHPLISRPQFLVAQAIVVVDIKGDEDAPHPVVNVRDVLWTSDPGLKGIGGKKLIVPDLIGCGKDQGYVGPGEYILPLIYSGSAWQIAPIPTPTAYRKPSHASIDVRSAGQAPTRVLDTLVAFADMKPVEASGLLDPVWPELKASEICAALFGDGFDWRDTITPHGVMPARLPVKDALALQSELKAAGATVGLIPVEVRIYQDTPAVREQVMDATKLRH